MVVYRQALSSHWMPAEPHDVVATIGSGRSSLLTHDPYSDLYGRQQDLTSYWGCELSISSCCYGICS